MSEDAHMPKSYIEGNDKMKKRSIIENKDISQDKITKNKSKGKKLALNLDIDGINNDYDNENQTGLKNNDNNITYKSSNKNIKNEGETSNRKREKKNSSFEWLRREFEQNMKELQAWLGTGTDKPELKDMQDMLNKHENLSKIVELREEALKSREVAQEELQKRQEGCQNVSAEFLKTSRTQYNTITLTCQLKKLYLAKFLI